MHSPLSQSTLESPGAIYTGSDLNDCINTYCQLWGVPHLSKRNPCSQPVSLERKHLPLITQGDYVVADKSDGIRYSLFLCKTENQHHSFLVDRKLAMYQIPVAANKRMFTGSIFDGELVWVTNANNERSQVLLLFDVVAYKGDTDIKNCNLHRRLEIIREAFDISGHTVASPRSAARCAKNGKIICGGNACGLSFRPKLCFPLCQLDTLLRHMDTLTYATDGLVFTPVDAANSSGTAESTFKLKTRHTVDLEFGKDEVLLGLGGGVNTAPHRVTLESIGVDIKYSPRIKAYIIQRHASQSDTGVIVECELLHVDDELHLEWIGTRTDKAHPNSVRTLLSTITNLREHIQPHELCIAQRIPQVGGCQQSIGALPQPVCCNAGLQGGAEIASIVVGDVVDSQRFGTLER